MEAARIFRRFEIWNIQCNCRISAFIRITFAMVGGLVDDKVERLATQIKWHSSFYQRIYANILIWSHQSFISPQWTRQHPASSPVPNEEFINSLSSLTTSEFFLIFHSADHSVHENMREWWESLEFPLRLLHWSIPLEFLFFPVQECSSSFQDFLFTLLELCISLILKGFRRRSRKKSDVYRRGSERKA